MAEVVTTQIVVGDEVRVHFHPPGSMRSFSEGVVRRVDVTTPQGRFFVIEVAHEVLLDREHRIRPGFEDYVLYECPNDFPGRIELLTTAEQDLEMYLASDLMIVDPLTEAEQEDDERLRCINLGGLGKGDYLRSRPVVSVQAPSLSSRDHPAVCALVLQIRNQLP
jgi:hypothetical protein